jgi:hemolysin activation/secretion protein
VRVTTIQKSQETPLKHYLPKTRSTTVRACVPLLAFATFGAIERAHAQTAPDAGSVLQQLPQQRQPALPARAPELLPAPAPLTSIGKAQVRVNEFRFSGNTLLDAAQLGRAVAGYQGRPLSFADLQSAAAAVAAAYREAGWIVRAYLPQQDVTAGTVTIHIVEARFGAVQVEGSARHVKPAQLQALVAAAQPTGAPVSVDALDRALLLIDDLPGISSKGRLGEGRKEAETDLLLSVEDGPMVSGAVEADNLGARSTGTGRVLASADLNSPLGRGDRGTGLLLHSQGSDYARAAYMAPIGDLGWRIGAHASYLRYKVVTADFAALDAHGSSNTAGFDASYPVVRSRLRNLFFTAVWDDTRAVNESGGQTASNYGVRALGLGMNGNLFDEFGGGGASTASVTAVFGRVDLDGSPNKLADAAGTDTYGSYDKVRYALTRQQSLTEHLSLYGSFSGQLATRNLDSTERFYLGGAGGVRAYPVSEGGGSEGSLLTVELRGQLPGNFDLTGFYDGGWVRQNRDNVGPSAVALNRYGLHGVGVSLGWVSSGGLVLRATVARRLGQNPNPTASGLDQDGSLEKNRLWLQASVPF